MGSPREIRTKDLDAAGHAVTGLPAAANPSDAVRLDQMQAGDAAVAAAASSALATEIAARIAGDTAVGAAAAAALATEITNRIAGDATTLTSSETFTTTAIAAQAFGTASSTTLQLIDASQLTEGAIRIVATYMAPWKLVDGTVNTRTTIPHRVLPAAGRTNWWWVRMVCDGDPFWQAQTQWYVDPAGTNSTPGDDEASGLSSSHPLKSIAEWRRRVRGANYGSSPPTIFPLSGSTVKDDGLFYGFTCETQVGFLKLMGTPTVIGSGTVTAYSPYSGNTRGSLTDTGMSAASWTAAGWVTTSSGSRFIRKTGSGARPYAPVLVDLGSKTVQLGVADNLDEAAFPLQPSISEVNFSVGDTYEIVTMLPWPALQPGPLIDIGVKCLDVSGIVISPMTGSQRFQLCGFIGTASILYPSHGGGFLAYNCVYCVSAAVVQFTGWLWFVANCSFLNVNVVTAFGGPDLNVNGELNVFIGGSLTFQNGARVSLGTMRFYDCSAPLITAQFGAGLNLAHSVVGSGNTGPLVSCHDGARVTGAAQITAATSKALPYTVNGVDFATPVVDGGSGDGIYN